MAKRLLGISLVLLCALCLGSIILYNLPAFHDRLSLRLANLRVQIREMINPPEQIVFVPQEQIDIIVQGTLQALTPSPTVTAQQGSSTPQPAEFQTATEPQPSPTFTPSPTAIPAQFLLSGIKHEYQKFNNCGPANLSMTLSYWDWVGDQSVTAAFLRGGEYDKNVMPSEMAAFVNTQSDLKALVRVGGELETIKKFIAAGYPVVIEKGYDPPDDDWMGHYLTFNGYDDSLRQFITQDSLILPDFPVAYELVEDYWRDFNHTYLIVYPPEKESEVMSILGGDADELANLQNAAQHALQETTTLEGRELFFAWFNLGSNLVALEDYVGAAEAFDMAFAVYPTILEDERPWRVMWYRDEPYAAYYYTGRYQDIINLANTTFFALGEYTLEESFYWRGRAKLALDDLNGALFDLKKALELNPRYTPAREELEKLGVEAS
ncbi:MAG: C39 family peptidase [Chloroflexota bacterium]|nr:MAG: C39 family peptidase [Chloroflexota bacterium]